jgi:pilus assembly protein Flp/PilA
MGETRQACRVPNAAGGRALGRLAARLHLTRFLRREDGATAIEYGLIVALIAVTIIAGLTTLSSSVQNNLYTVIQTALNGI